jgi:hypothetical protein
MSQPPHLDRRGRTTTGPPEASRSTRERAHPHGRNTPEQSGQTNSPRIRRTSTRAGSTSTVSTAPPRATRPSRRSAKRYREGLSHALSSARCRPKTAPLRRQTRLPILLAQSCPKCRTRRHFQ